MLVFGSALSVGTPATVRAMVGSTRTGATLAVRRAGLSPPRLFLQGFSGTIAIKKSKLASRYSLDVSKIERPQSSQLWGRSVSRSLENR